MRLIAVYILFLTVGEAIAYGLGRAVEHWSPASSMPVFLGCFFAVFWAAWRLAVQVT